MSSSVKSIQDSLQGAVIVRYTVAAVACALFAIVYAHFSHGVHSPFMTFMFMVPLLGGALPSLIAHVANVRPAPRVSRQAWALALASLTVACCLRGIFEIAGTNSPLLVVYPAIAVLFAIVAVVGFARGRA